ncbi:MAG: hypothetical protein COU85_02275, partial [Candidatus Portnoybacteria bacterium CG10_big_fil_rev_8_21_14_0_10_44_7]
AQAHNFKKIFSGQKGAVLLSLKELAENQQKTNWAVFVWLSLCDFLLRNRQASRQARGLEEFLPAIKDKNNFLTFVRRLQQIYWQTKDATLNHRLLLENLILQT